MSDLTSEKLTKRVILPGICTSCGVCIALSNKTESQMVASPCGPVPHFADGDVLPEIAWTVCPGKGIDYPALYRAHYGKLPDNWLLGMHVAVRTGYAADPVVRRTGASGGVTTAVLIHLLRSKRIDAAILGKQRRSASEETSVVMAETPEQIQASRAAKFYANIAETEQMFMFSFVLEMS